MHIFLLIWYKNKNRWNLMSEYLVNDYIIIIYIHKKNLHYAKEYLLIFKEFFLKGILIILRGNDLCV